MINDRNASLARLQDPWLDEEDDGALREEVSGWYATNYFVETDGHCVSTRLSVDDVVRRWKIFGRHIDFNPSLVQDVMDEDGETRLHHYCRYGAPSTVIGALVRAWPAAVARKNHRGRTPLHVACKAKAPLGTIESPLGFFCALIEQPVLPVDVTHHLTLLTPCFADARDDDGYSPIHFAVRGHNARSDVVELLLQVTPVSILMPANGEPILLHAMRWSANLGVLRVIVDTYHILLTMTDTQRRTPLHAACEYGGDWCVVEWLLQVQPGAITSETAEHMTPLQYACQKQAHSRVIQSLIRAALARLIEPGDDLAHFVRWTWEHAMHSDTTVELAECLAESLSEPLEYNMRLTPLHIACFNGAPLAVIAFVANRWPDWVRAFDSTGETPLHLACSCRKEVSIDVVRFLMKKWPEGVQVVDTVTRQRPLHVAVYNDGASDVIKLLLDAWPEAVRHADVGGRIPLHDAWSPQIAQLLIDAWPDSIEQVDACGWTPLHNACASLHCQTVGAILAAGPEMTHMRCLYGATPLHMACWHGQPLSTVKKLIEVWPDAVHSLDNIGLKPLDYANGHGPYVEQYQVRRQEVVDHLAGLLHA